jgi:spore maturation protein CgeB
MEKILCLGAQWLGSDDGGLFRGFQKNGHIIRIVDPFYFWSFDAKTFVSKCIRRLISFNQVKEYNREIKLQSQLLKPSLVIVYKGTHVLPDTIRWIKKNYDCPVINVYPDVSFWTHGKHIPQCIPLYDHIFSTKTFGIKDLKDQFNYTAATLIHHAMDTDVHKLFNASAFAASGFANDVSFIGKHTIKKEAAMQTIAENCSEVNIKIWGNDWESVNGKLKPCVQGAPVFGDLYAIAIQSSKINMGILSERVKGASSGDLITARSFHIPGSGGFMLHERNEEILAIFQEDKHIACYESDEELVDKVNYFLNNNQERERIRISGYEYVNQYHTQSNRAQFVIAKLKDLQLLK